jgi:hypothetical protein
LSTKYGNFFPNTGGILPDLKDGASTLQSGRFSGIEPENLPCRSIPLVNAGVFTQTALIDKLVCFNF